MVNKTLYAVRDAKVGFNSNVMMYPNEASAIRDFANLCKNPDVIYHHNPEDFSLYQVGIFSLENGSIDGTVYKCVAKAIDFVEV